MGIDKANNSDFLGKIAAFRQAQKPNSKQESSSPEPGESPKIEAKKGFSPFNLPFVSNADKSQIERSSINLANAREADEQWSPIAKIPSLENLSDSAKTVIAKLKDISGTAIERSDTYKILSSFENIV